MDDFKNVSPIALKKKKKKKCVPLHFCWMCQDIRQFVMNDKQQLPTVENENRFQEGGIVH